MSVYKFSCNSITGEEVSLAAFKGKVLLIVNTASACGFTGQYKGLEALYRELRDKGLVVLGFPCNQFGQQESGSEAEISEFCEINFGVSFPLFTKIDVNGENAHPLYLYLKKQAKGILGSEKIKWNFTKFLVDRQGKVVKRYGPADKPENIRKDIAALLGGGVEAEVACQIKS